MAISITLYQFDKLRNSTKLPVVSAGTLATSCELKTGCSLITPVITFHADTFKDGSAIVNPMRFSYASISDFGRYYWITNWTWNNGIWSAALQVDVLASFKTQIGASTQYVLRSASRYNTDLADSKYMTFYKSGRVSSTYNRVGSPWKVSLSAPDCNTGFFVVGIVNSDQNAIGATSYYYFAPKSLRYFLGKLMAAPSWMNITDASLTTDLQKIMFNPMQYIVSCMYIPMALPAAFATSDNMMTDIPIGWWNIDVSGAPAMSIFRAVTSHPSSALGFDITIPRHPATAARPYAKLSPYSEYSLELWPYGLIALDSSKVYGSDTLHASIEVDFITGRGILSLICGSGAPFYESVSQVGIPVSVGQITLDRSTITSGGTWLMSAGLTLVKNHDVVSNVQSYVDTLTNPDDASHNVWDYIAAGAGEVQQAFRSRETAQQTVGQIAESIVKDASDIVNGAIASAGTCSYQGQTGGFAQYTNDVRCIIHYCDLADEDITQYGRPLCEVARIDTLSGYILCATGDVQANAIKAERDLISAYLTGGFYYE